MSNNLKPVFVNIEGVVKNVKSGAGGVVYAEVSRLTQGRYDQAPRETKYCVVFRSQRLAQAAGTISIGDPVSFLCILEGDRPQMNEEPNQFVANALTVIKINPAMPSQNNNSQDVPF